MGLRGRRPSGDVTSRWYFAAVTSMYAWSVSCLRRCLRKDSALQLHSPRWVGSRLARPQFGHLRAVQRPLLPARLPRGARWAVQRPLLPARLPRGARWAVQRPLLPARLLRGARWAVQRSLLPARLPRGARWAVQRSLLPARLPRGAYWVRLLRLPWWFSRRCQNER